VNVIDMGGNVHVIMHSTGIPEVDDLFMRVLKDRHLDHPFPIGAHVMPRMSQQELVGYLMRRLDMKHLEALGAAQVIKEGPNEVIGINDLTDEKGANTYVSFMTNDGLMYFMEESLLKEG